MFWYDMTYTHTKRERNRNSVIDCNVNEFRISEHFFFGAFGTLSSFLKCTHHSYHSQQEVSRINLDLVVVSHLNKESLFRSMEFWFNGTNVFRLIRRRENKIWPKTKNQKLPIFFWFDSVVICKQNQQSESEWNQSNNFFLCLHSISI